MLNNVCSKRLVNTLNSVNTLTIRAIERVCVKRIAHMERFNVQCMGFQYATTKHIAPENIKRVSIVAVLALSY